MNQLVIETRALTKHYRAHTNNGKNAVDHVDLAVPEGCIYGFLGPNGAGKSTTMKMLLGLIHPTGGDITILGTPLSVDGHPVSEKERLAVLKQTGSLIESPSYYAHLTGRENLEILCRLKSVPTQEIDEVLAVVRMKRQQHKKAAHYSLGMKQRLGLAGALLGRPNLLLLDEPTNGLDPAGIQEMRDLIRSLPKTRQMTVMVSSHLLSEIDQMADRVGIINHGRLIYQDSLSSLHEHRQNQITLRTADNARASRILQANDISCLEKEGLLWFTEDNEQQTAFLIRTLVQNDIDILRVEEHQRSLEEIFLQLTGKQVSL